MNKYLKNASLAVALVLSSFAVQAGANTAKTGWVELDLFKENKVEFGNCMARTKVFVGADSPTKQLPLNCPSHWVSFDCAGNFHNGREGQEMYNLAQRAYRDGDLVRFTLTDKHKYDKYCLAIGIETEQGATLAMTSLEREVIETVRVNITFDTNRHNIKPNYFAEIEKLANLMRQHPTATLLIEGHTDSTGTDAINQPLSERRAASVKDMLISRYNINPMRLESRGYGSTRPVADNSTVSGRAMNRRVQATLLAND